MSVYIAVSDSVFNLPARQEFDDGTVIEKIFNHVILIKTKNKEIIDWFSAVIDIVPDDFYLIQTTPNDEHYELQWHHHPNEKGNRTENFWSRFSEFNYTNKAVCIIDTGVAPHPDLDNARITINHDNDYVYALSIKNGNEITKHTTIDDDEQYIHPHGTHVAGIAGGIIDNEIGIAGVYRNRIFSINVFQEIWFLGQKYVGAYTSSILNALSICKNNSSSIRTINMSLGGGWRLADYQAYLYAFQELYEAGIIVVMASGNSGYEVSVWRPLPAYVKTDNSFTIASSNINGEKSWFSNYDSYLCEAMVAGGSVIKALSSQKYEDDDILSCLPADCDDEVYSIIDDGAGGKYGYMAGTSMASPYCAGLLNILYNLLKEQYEGHSFGWYVSALKKLLIGATYNHSEDLFDQCAGGGIIDTTLMSNSLTAPLIVDVNYDNENEILNIMINNFTGTSQTVWVSIATNQFVSPFEQSNNTIYTGSFTVNTGLQTITINLDADTYYSIEKAGILTAYWNGTTLIGCYGKWRIYNSFECPTSTCSNVSIRCDENTYIPLKATDYPLMNATLLSTLAERSQKRFLFFFGSQQDQYGRWSNLYPVATNGVCLNTINYPNATHPFQCRFDANENDVMYAYYALYTQWRDIYEKGFVYNGQRWFVFDYEAWLQSNRTAYKRKILPDNMKFDETFLRKDKIGNVVRAINMMIFWAKIVFAVSYELKYVMKPLSIYGERFKKKRILPAGASFTLPTYNGGLAGHVDYELYLPYYEENGHYRVYWDGYYFSDPYLDYNPGYWYIYGDEILGIDSDNSSYIFKRIGNLPLNTSSGLGAGIEFPNGKDIKWIGLTYTDDEGFGTESISYYFGNLPFNLFYEKQNEVDYYEISEYNSSELVSMHGTDGIHSLYFDTSEYINTQCEPTFIYLEGDENGLNRRGGSYSINDEYYADTMRGINGSYGYISHNVSCVEVSVPVALQIELMSCVAKHSDAISPPQHMYPYVWMLGDENDTYEPNTQSFSSRFKVTIKLYSNGNYTTVHEKTYTINGGGGSYTIVSDTLIIDVKTNEHILVMIEPDYDIICSNPTHSLIVPRANIKNTIAKVPLANEIIFTNMLGQNGHYDDFASFELETQYQSSLEAIGCYTRRVSSGVYVKANNNGNMIGFEYPDLRGLPVEDETYMQSIFSFLGVVELKENDERYKSKYSGWRSYGSNDPSGYAIIDQMPPYKYPNVDDNKVYVLVGKILSASEKPKYSKPASIEGKLNIVVPCCNRSGHNYFIPHNNVLYELDNFNKRKSIVGIISSNIPNLVGLKYDKENNKFIDYEIDENYSVEVVDDYYHPEADDTTIQYQFPTERHFASVNKIYIFIPTSNDTNDYDVVYIPDLRGLTTNEIEEYETQFNIVSIGECISSYGSTIIADQFPRGGVWRVKKGVDKITIYVMTGMNSYNIVARILNYVV